MFRAAGAAGAAGHQQPKCIRTNDIENVGRTARHHVESSAISPSTTSQQAIEWAWELSTGVYGIDPKNLVVRLP